MLDGADRQRCKVVWLVGQDDPWHRRRVGTEKLRPATIGFMNGKRAETDGHEILVEQAAAVAVSMAILLKF